jgi:hypothetical protein
MIIVYGVLILAGITGVLSLCKAAGRADECIDDMTVGKKDL